MSVLRLLLNPQDMLSKHLPPPAKDNLVMVCGPPGMMDAISGNKAKDFSQVCVLGCGAGIESMWGRCGWWWAAGHDGRHQRQQGEGLFAGVALR